MGALVVLACLQDPDLLDRLADDRIDVREEAEAGLERLGRRALPMLWKGSRSDDLEVRTRCDRRRAALLERRVSHLLLVAPETNAAVLGLYRQIESWRAFKCVLWIGEPRLPDLTPYDAVILFDAEPDAATLSHVRDSGWGVMVIDAGRATEFADGAPVEADHEIFAHVPLPDGKRFALPRIDRVGRAVTGEPLLRLNGEKILATSGLGHGRVIRSATDAFWRASPETADGRYVEVLTREVLAWLARRSTSPTPRAVVREDAVILVCDAEVRENTVVFFFRRRRFTGEGVVTWADGPISRVWPGQNFAAESSDDVYIVPKR